jgi:hypothetical protein
MVQDRDLFLPGTGLGPVPMVPGLGLALPETGLGLYLPETGFSGKAPLRNDNPISFIVTQY